MRTFLERVNTCHMVFIRENAALQRPNVKNYTLDYHHEMSYGSYKNIKHEYFFRKLFSFYSFLVLPASLQSDTAQSRNDQDSEEDLVTPAVEAQIFPEKV